MSSVLVLAVFAVAIAGLYFLDRPPKLARSKALWLPLFWLLIAASRNIGEWFQTFPPAQNGDQYLEGNPLDRTALALCVAAGIGVLITRSPAVRRILKKNYAIIFYFAYCLISVAWSDFPYVGFKRWIRSVGDLVMVLIVLTDVDPVQSLKWLLSRAGYLLLPLSVMVIRYFPDVGRVYGAWDGVLMWTGVTSTKNQLGMICLVFGLGALWRLMTERKEQFDKRYWRPLLAQGVVLSMALWLLWISNSMTSISCFAMASLVMFFSKTRLASRHRVLVHVMVITFVVASFSVLFLNTGASALQAMGRNSTLTGRTEVWDIVLKTASAPLLGAGFESFWVGDRLRTIQTTLGDGINQCHNGYLEVYVNLGTVGLVLLLWIFATAYQHALQMLRSAPQLGMLCMGYFLICVIYNFTEAGVKMMYPVWVCFLLSTLIVPKRVEDMSRSPLAALRPRELWDLNPAHSGPWKLT